MVLESTEFKLIEYFDDYQLSSSAIAGWDSSNTFFFSAQRALQSKTRQWDQQMKQRLSKPGSSTTAGIGSVIG